MKLYRARPISQRPRRHAPFEGNAAENRIKGRWFTSDIGAAMRHGEENLAGQDWEIVVVEVKDDFAEAHRVAMMPRTRCALDPIDFAVDPEIEYVIPTWVAMEARTVGADGRIRERDYLFRTQRHVPVPGKSKVVHEIAKKLDVPVIDIKIAA